MRDLDVYFQKSELIPAIVQEAVSYTHLDVYKRPSCSRQRAILTEFNGRADGPMKKTIFTGAGVAIVTPMHDDLSINWELLGELIDYQIDNGTDAIVIVGTTGEASTLTDEEHVKAIRYAVERTAGRVPVVAGTGSNHTDYSLWLSKEAKQAGADGLLLVTPYYNKTSQAGLVRHFLAVADTVDLPVILYNVPSRTGMNIQPKTYLELSKHPNIVAAKEASGNISQIAMIRSLCGDGLDIYSGNDDQIVPILSLGGKGVISVLSNVAPRQTDVYKRQPRFF